MLASLQLGHGAGAHFLTRGVLRSVACMHAVLCSVIFLYEHSEYCLSYDVVVMGPQGIR